MMPIVPMTDEFSPNARRNWKLPNGIQVIGISGHAGAGKDAVAAYIYMTFADTYSEGFADPLKDACAAAFGIPLSDFNSRETKEVIDPFWGVSPRMIAQFVGTELFRNNASKLLPKDFEDFWVCRMFGKLSGFRRGESDGDYVAGDTVVIPDVRFQNEVDFINDNNGVHIHLIRPGADGKVGLSDHASEAQNFSLQGDSTYVVKNDRTLEYLFERVHNLVTSKLELVPLSITNDL